MLKKRKLPSFPIPSMKASKEARAMLYRWVAAGLIWLLLIGFTIYSLRTYALTSEAVEFMRGRALTPETAEKLRLAAETARGFSAEWATFDGIDREDYSQRLAAYLGEGRNPEPPSGFQRCNLASVISTEQVKEKKDLYRGRVLLHLSRLVEMPEENVYDISDFRKVRSNTQELRVWREELMAVETTVKIEKDSLKVMGLPVIVPLPKREAGEILQGGEVPGDFYVFIQQAMTMYFEGHNMANFSVPGAPVFPLGGYTLKDVAVTGFEEKDSQAKAVIQARVSGTGLDEMPVTLVVEATKNDRWLLNRIGSW